MTVEKLQLIADRDALQVGMTARVHAVEVAFDQDGNETHTVELALVEGDVALVDPLVEAILAVERGELGFSDLVDLAPATRRQASALPQKLPPNPLK